MIARSLLLLYRVVETVVAVSLITALIWLYAEGENVKPYTLPMTVRFAAPQGRSIAVEPEAAQSLRVTFRCAAAQLEEMRSLASGVITLAVGDEAGQPDGPADEYERVVTLRDALARQTAIGRMGVQLVEVEPQGIRVRLRRLERLTLPIDLITGDARLAGPAVIEPAEADVLAPARVVPAIKGLRPWVRLDQALTLLEPNREHRLTQRLLLPEALDRPEITVTPQRVQVTLTLRNRTDTLRLDGVRLLLLAPPAELVRYVVRLDNDQRVLADPVEIAGPADRIDRLRADPAQVVAVVRLTAEELASAVTSKQPTLTLPDGVTATTALPRINLSITARPQP